MRKSLLLFPIVFLLAAWGWSDNSKIEDIVRQNLKDPGSAQFKDIIFSADKRRACIVWNAKNSLGGYGGWHIAEFKKENSEWVVKDMDVPEPNCREISFQAFDAKEKAEIEAQLKAIEILQKVKNISSEEAAELGINGECREIVWKYAYESGSVAEYRVLHHPWLPDAEKALKESQAILDSGNCAN
ncbi:hypothetical protein AGMMS50256_01350 [Betaproteobacteria bacterium]|nr:hypothetical protein AGMMS50256_01350 [Betaproteobacteria bacterium]